MWLQYDSRLVEMIILASQFEFSLQKLLQSFAKQTCFLKSGETFIFTFHFYQIKLCTVQLLFCNIPKTQHVM